VCVLRINFSKSDLNVSDLDITLFSDRFCKQNVSNNCSYWFSCSSNCAVIVILQFAISLGYVNLYLEYVSLV
jgi:hypothetical protein